MIDKRVVQTDPLTGMALILQALALEGGHKRTMISQIRESLELIEAAQKNGFSLRVISEAFTNHGVMINESYLKNVLKRIRSDRRKHVNDPPNHPVPLQQSVSQGNTAAKSIGFIRTMDRDSRELF